MIETTFYLSISYLILYSETISNQYQTSFIKDDVTTKCEFQPK